jgi:ribosomal protein S4
MGNSHHRKRKRRAKRGSNRSLDARLARSVVGPSPKWSELSPEMGRMSQKRVGNMWLVSPRTMVSPDSAGEGTSMHVKARYGRTRLHRAKRRAMYGRRRSLRVRRGVVSRLGSRTSSLQSQLGTLSLLTPVEMRLDVILWRSGLVVSLNMAHQWVQHQHVSVVTETGPLTSKVHSSLQMRPGWKLQVEPSFWAKQRKRRDTYWSHGMTERGIPGYIMVDLPRATVTVLRRPRDDEVRVTETSTRSLRSLRQR